jgi:hypothetical protein
LQYSSLPPRVLPAIFTENYKVTGPCPISAVKTVAATTMATSIAALFFPQFAVTARLITVLASAIASGTWAHFGLSARRFFEEARINDKKRKNAEYSQTFIDGAREEATSRDIEKEIEELTNKDMAEFCEALGLDPNQNYSPEELQKAFNERIKEVHSDIGGSDAMTRELLEAREKYRHSTQHKSGPNKNGSASSRHFSTYTRQPTSPAKKNDALFKEPPRSNPHPNTGHLISLVLEQKKYSEALRLIKEGKVHVDGHDSGENTLLTEAVKRKDVEGVRFALQQAKCSVDLSCDCPLHNTAIHYWAEGAGSNGGQSRAAEKEIFELLIQHEARINLINSSGQTPLDMTRDNDSAKMLLDHGGKRHYSLPGLTGSLVKLRGTLFGYPPNQRTLLMQPPQNQVELPKTSSSRLPRK